MLIVLAGNRAEYLLHLKTVGISSQAAVYGDAKNLFGLHSDGILEIGSFRQRSDSEYLESLAKSRVRPTDKKEEFKC